MMCEKQRTKETRKPRGKWLKQCLQLYRYLTVIDALATDDDVTGPHPVAGPREELTDIRKMTMS
jgi:hypothetical protein